MDLYIFHSSRLETFSCNCLKCVASFLFCAVQDKEVIQLFVKPYSIVFTFSC